MTPREKKFLDAAASGDRETVIKLLEDGVDVNVRDSRGLPTNRTALMHAAEKGHAQVVDVLLLRGAQANAIDKGFPIDCPGGNTALILAIVKGHTKVAHRLLDAGASAKTKGGGTSVINAAAYLGDAELVERLIQLGADVNQRDGSGFVPIGSAAMQGHIPVVQLLLNHGVDPNSKTPGGSPVLRDAIFAGKLELCNLLIKRGADPHLADADGFTPLMTACVAIKPAIVDMLLSHGVAVNHVDCMGRTALDIVYKLQEPPDFAPDVLKRLTKLGQITILPAGELQKMFESLRRAGAKTSEELRQACPKKNDIA